MYIDFMMSKDIQISLQRLRALGTPEEFREGSFQAHGSGPVPGANAHVHLPPNFSAFQSVRQAVALAAGQSVHVLGASNYYDFGIYADFAALAWQHGIFPLFGLEIIALLQDLQRAAILINDPGNPGRMYICGKGIVRFAPMTPAARELMRWIRLRDAERMRRMADLVEEVFAGYGVKTGLDAGRIVARLAERGGLEPDSICLQERHIAQAFQEEFFALVRPHERHDRLSAILKTTSQAESEDALKTQHEIRAALMKVGRPAFVAERFVDFDQAYRLVLELGGIPCYPTLADGARPICAYEDPPEKLVEALRRNRIHCAEFIPIRNRSEVLERYVGTLRRAGIVVVGGTEHNTPDLLPLEPRCIQGLPVPEAVRAVFWEGACVIAAHQFLSLHGRCGYVDAAGNLNGDYRGVEDRISFLAGLGETVIARYHRAATTEGTTSTHA